jgi:hypothetical protein
MTIWTYALPIPMNFGLLHWPSLTLGMAALAWTARRGNGGRGLLAALALGLALAGMIAAWDVQRGRFDPGPLSLYSIVDGVGLLLFASSWWNSPSAAPIPTRLAFAAFAGPMVLALGLQGVFLRESSQWRPARSEWNEAANLETLDYFPTRNTRMPDNTAEGCTLLARMAPEPYPRQGPMAWPRRHRILRLYAEVPSGRVDESTPPLLTYEWWPGRAEGVCTDTGFTR